MEIMRLIVTGTVGAGKSTFVRSVNEIELVDPDRRAPQLPSLLAEKTELGLDYARLHFGPQMGLLLYGTRGHTRFDFMWDLLIRRAHAYILLLAANRPGDFHHAYQIMALMNQRVQIPMIIGLTHTDCPETRSMQEIAFALGFRNSTKQPPMVIVNPTQKASVTQALITLIKQYISNIHSNDFSNFRSSMGGSNKMG